MPSVSELEARANYLVDSRFQFDELLFLFNECLEDLSTASGYVKEATSTTSDSESSLRLPDDFIEIIDLTCGGESIHSTYKGFPSPHQYTYKILGDSIEVKGISGELKLRYFAKYPTLKAANDIPSIDTRFHRLLPLFAAARYMQNEQDEFQAKNDFFQEYLDGKAKFELEMLKKKRQLKGRTVMKYRDWY